MMTIHGIEFPFTITTKGPRIWPDDAHSPPGKIEYTCDACGWRHIVPMGGYFPLGFERRGVAQRILIFHSDRCRGASSSRVKRSEE